MFTLYVAVRQASSGSPTYPTLPTVYVRKSLMAGDAKRRAIGVGTGARVACKKRPTGRARSGALGAGAADCPRGALVACNVRFESMIRGRTLLRSPAAHE